jgi:ATP-dependent helicase HrpA
LKQLLGEQKIESKSQFDDVLEIARGNYIATVTENANLLLTVLSKMTVLRKALKGKLSPFAIASYQDINTTLNALLYPHFLRKISHQRLQCFTRYLSSLKSRLEKLPQSVNRDRAFIENITEWRYKLEQINSQLQDWSPLQDKSEELHWMLDELSVSLFSQELGTVMTVSAKRLEKKYKSLIDDLG